MDPIKDVDPLAPVTRKRAPRTPRAASAPAAKKAKTASTSRPARARKTVPVKESAPEPVEDDSDDVSSDPSDEPPSVEEELYDTPPPPRGVREQMQSTCQLSRRRDAQSRIDIDLKLTYSPPALPLRCCSPNLPTPHQRAPNRHRALSPRSTSRRQRRSPPLDLSPDSVELWHDERDEVDDAFEDRMIRTIPGAEALYAKRNAPLPEVPLEESRPLGPVRRPVVFLDDQTQPAQGEHDQGAQRREGEPHLVSHTYTPAHAKLLSSGAGTCARAGTCLTL
jgi:hypothetical protein